MSSYPRLLSLSDIQLADRFPMRLHPEFKDVEPVVEAICESLGIKLPHYHNYQSMTYFMFPDTSSDRLIALSILSNLLYYIDDLYDRHKSDPHPDTEFLPSRFKHIIRVFSKGQAAMPQESHLLYDAALALHHHFLELSNEQWFFGFAKALTDHLMATRPSSSDEIEVYATVQDYFCVRELDGGIWTSIRSIELAANHYLPSEVLEHEHIQDISILCGRIATLTNDLFSYEKEVINMGSHFNLVAVLMDTESLRFDEAVHYAISAINADIDQFIIGCDTVPDFGSEALNAGVRMYIEGLKNILSATWHWQMSTDRYRSTTSPFAELHTAS